MTILRYLYLSVLKETTCLILFTPDMYVGASNFRFLTAGVLGHFIIIIIILFIYLFIFFFFLMAPFSTGSLLVIYIVIGYLECILYSSCNWVTIRRLYDGVMLRQIILFLSPIGLNC